MTIQLKHDKISQLTVESEPFTANVIDDKILDFAERSSRDKVLD